MNPLRYIGARTLSALLLLLVFDLCLRHLGGYGKWTVQELDEYLGWRMLPNQHAWSRDLTIPERINSVDYRAPRKLAHPPAGASGAALYEAPEIGLESGGERTSCGYRDRDWAAPARDAQGLPIKDAGLYRVAVVGNSFTFGTSVAVEQIWSRELERGLAADFAARGDARQVLVMNFAVQGYVFEQMARTYERVIRPFRPDLLIVPCLAHDVVPMEPSIDDPEYGFRRWVIRSATYDFLRNHVIDKWIEKPPSTVSEAALAAKQLDREFQARSYEPEFRPLWSAAGARMGQIRAQVETDGGRLALVSLPQLIRVLSPKLPGPGTYWENWVREQREPGGKTAVPWIEPIGRFRSAMPELAQEIVERKGILPQPRGPDQLEPSLPHIDQSLFLVEDTGHFSAKGHALLALALVEALAPWIARR